jgi:hypothetical protein
MLAQDDHSCSASTSREFPLGPTGQEAVWAQSEVLVWRGDEYLFHYFYEWIQDSSSISAINNYHQMCAKKALRAKSA